MNNLNTVLVEGQLTRDPERMGPEGSSMCRMGIANNRYYFSEKEGRWIPDTSFFTIQVYGTAAESCLSRLKKGRGIRVVGKLKQYINKYTNNEKVFIQAEHIEVQPKRVTEKQEIPEQDKLQGVPVTNMNMQELDKEDEEEAVVNEQQELQAESDGARISEETAEKVDEAQTQQYENEEEKDAF